MKQRHRPITERQILDGAGGVSHCVSVGTLVAGAWENKGKVEWEEE